MEELKNKIISWAEERNLLNKENTNAQMLKVVEEIGELSSAILKKDNDKIIDAIGDVLVTIIILSKQLELDPVECLETAWSEIKDRKGKTENGTFIKDNK